MKFSFKFFFIILTLVCSISNAAPNLIYSWDLPTEITEDKNGFVESVIHTASDNTVSLVYQIYDSNSDRKHKILQKYSLSSGQLLKELRVAGKKEFFSANNGEKAIFVGFTWSENTGYLCNAMEVLDLTTYKLTHFNISPKKCTLMGFIRNSEKFILVDNLRGEDNDKINFYVYNINSGILEKTYEDTESVKYFLVDDYTANKKEFSTKREYFYHLNRISPKQSDVIDLSTDKIIASGPENFKFESFIGQKSKIIVQMDKRYFVYDMISGHVIQEIDNRFWSSIWDGYYFSGNNLSFTLFDFERILGVFKLYSPELSEKEIENFGDIRFSSAADLACTGSAKDNSFHLYCGSKVNNSYLIKKIDILDDHYSAGYKIIDGQIRVWSRDYDYGLTAVYDAKSFNKIFDRPLYNSLFIDKNKVVGFTNGTTPKAEYWQIIP